ncbi:MAG: S41 family peptidase [Saprospiraceae bacterium]|nr:S41 family peptidase [Saprospiraceae bacterium]
MDKQHKTYNYLQPLLLGLAVAVGILVGFRLNELPENSLIYAGDREDADQVPAGRIEELIRFIEHKYVDQIDRDLLISDAVEAVFAHLDPHSVYLTPDEVDQVSEQMEGSYAGLGVENFMIDDTVVIASVLPESPAKIAGLQTFDQILAIDGTPAAGVKMPHEEVRKLLRKQPGTKVQLQIYRKKQKQTISVIVDDIPVKSVHSCKISGTDIAYIKIDQFSNSTYREFMDVVESSFGEGKARHMVLDLRDNPGGYLPEATNILCQLFTEKEKLLLYTEGRNNKRNEYKTNGKQFFEIDKIVVLINEQSASASEIIAGAIQDWDRGLIVGRRSYGKGLVQEQYPLTNGGAVRLTVARYYTPSGRSIQRDYSDRESWEQDYSQRVENGEMFESDTTGASQTPYATLQLKRKVKGGGGITPDIFVPMAGVVRNEDIVMMLDMLPEFTFRYLRQKRGQVPATAEALARWKMDDQVSTAFSEFLSVSDNTLCQPATDQVQLMYPQIKMYFGKWLFGDQFLPYMQLAGDPFIQEASIAIARPSLIPSNR